MVSAMPKAFLMLASSLLPGDRACGPSQSLRGLGGPDEIHIFLWSGFLKRNFVVE